MQKRTKMGIVAIGVAGVLGVGWWLGSPLFLDRMVNEPVPEMEAIAPGMAEKPGSGSMADMAMYTGMFRDGDASHHVKGKASVVSSGGMQYLRFEDFEATNGPDLFVYLVGPGMSVGDGIHLGALKGNIGSQNYEIPAGTDLSMHSQVVIWCRTFNVTFGTADLANPM
ncbi:MAG TPA: DM13 domain-containing protein [Symbiobacteriaceae bacterium]|nr:DM13 domain-containing protein [Symbiobacteriaceae bacterium]